MPISKFKTGILCLITLSLAVYSKGDEDTLKIASKLAQQAVDTSLALEIATDLTTDIGPRLYGSESEKRAVEWARARFQDYGFDKIWSEPFPVDRGWERGHETASITHPAPQNLVITALGGSVPTPDGGIEAEIVVFKTIQALLDQPVGSLDGKIAVVTQAMEIGGYGRFSGPIRQNGPSEAAKRGAIAYLMRSAGTDNDRMAILETRGTNRESVAFPLLRSRFPTHSRLTGSWIATNRYVSNFCLLRGNSELLRVITSLLKLQVAKNRTRLSCLEPILTRGISVRVRSMMAQG